MLQARQRLRQLLTVKLLAAAALGAVQRLEGCNRQWEDPSYVPCYLVDRKFQAGDPLQCSGLQSATCRTG